jgi:hypothetical protein
MNIFREILSCGISGACGGSGRYATLQKDGDNDMWREHSLCEGEPSLPPVPGIIRFHLLQINTETDEYDDEENLVGLAFVDDTKHQKTSFEAFMEMEDFESVEQSIEDVLLSTWSSFPSLSTDDEDDSYNNWNKSPVKSFDDGYSYGSRSDKNISNLFFPVGEKQTMRISPENELSQGTMTTASSGTTFDFEREYGEI